MELVLLHHERFDGGGYPRGQPAADLPLGTQIIAVADSLDAMTSDRPYRQAMRLEEAMAELRRGRGTQWHPQVVDALDGLVAPAERPSLDGARVGVPA
jgi:HD-GYP domain-containing protein (c-di-GMP phosphodiesterase class II)